MKLIYIHSIFYKIHPNHFSKWKSPWNVPFNSCSITSVKQETPCGTEAVNETNKKKTK